MENPTIYVASLYDYNNGRLEGKFFDLTDYSNASELMEAIDEMLQEVTKKYNDGEIREEYAVHDYENIPNSLISEYSGQQDFQIIYDIMNASEKVDIPFEVLLERVADTGSDDYGNIAESLFLVVNGSDESDIVYEIENQLGLSIDFWNNYSYIDDVTEKVMYGEDVERFRNDIEDENSYMDEDEIQNLAEQKADEEESRRKDDLQGYLEDYGYDTIPSFVSKDYQSAWDNELSYNYSVVNFDDKMYVFSNNYSFGGGLLQGTKFSKGGVVFTNYNGSEIMYEPNYEEYFVNDRVFYSMEEAKNYIDNGESENEYAKGGLTEHALKEGDKIVKDFSNIRPNTISVMNDKKAHFVDLDKGKRFKNGGKVSPKFMAGGFIPMDLEEKLALLSKWGGTNIKGVIGYLNAMIDSGLTDNDLVINPTKNTRFQRERAVEKKIKEIWEKIEPQYKGNLKGNMYYSTLKELIRRNYIYENLLQKFKPYRKYQKFDNGGSVSNENNENYEMLKNKSIEFKRGGVVTYKIVWEDNNGEIKSESFDTIKEVNDLIKNINKNGGRLIERLKYTANDFGTRYFADGGNVSNENYEMLNNANDFENDNGLSDLIFG